jgi:hypothetical protein
MNKALGASRGFLKQRAREIRQSNYSDPFNPDANNPGGMGK